jgi:hypothetical protein
MDDTWLIHGLLNFTSLKRNSYAGTLLPETAGNYAKIHRRTDFTLLFTLMPDKFLIRLSWMENN